MTFFFTCMVYLRINRKEKQISGNLCRLPSTLNVTLKFSSITYSAETISQN